MTATRRFVARLAALLLFAGLTAWPAPDIAAAPTRARLSEADRADLARVEDYLAQVQTLRARFLQVSSNGEFAEGDLFLSRPGKMRIDYDPPMPILIVADGRWLVFYDEELEQVSYVPLGSTPASILTRENLSFTGQDLIVTDYRNAAGTIRITVVKADEPKAGTVTLVFDANPVVLRKWSVVDAQGLETQVTLVTSRAGVPLNDDLFFFADPNFAKPKD